MTNWIIVKNSLWWEDKMTVMFQKVRTAGTSGASVTITTGTSGARPISKFTKIYKILHYHIRSYFAVTASHVQHHLVSTLLKFHTLN